ncbi:MAG: alpha-2-macroglobulin, partial [Tannerellaceae bacterium]|nr:alpha-2-macroglobulin [Tannerellaceae bacterium]
SNRTVYPSRNLELRLHYKNIREATVRIYKSARKIEDTLGDNVYAETDNRGRPEFEASFVLEPKNTYAGNDTVLSVPVGAPGLYEYTVTSRGLTLRAGNIFSVSRLAAVARYTPQGQTEVLVTDYLSGKPVGGASVYYYGGLRRAPQHTGTVKTDSDGLALIPAGEGVHACRPATGEDVMSPLISLYPSRRIDDAKATTQVGLFTDRGIYRPGQTVYFKGIAFTTDRENPRAVPNNRFEVTLRDANYNELSRKSFTSNALGSFNGEFVLPAGALTGWFTLSCGNGSTSIQVEEYKRPSFMIDLSPVTDEVAFGDEITLRGKAVTFSGVSLSEGTAAWRIIRRPFMLRPAYGTLREEQVAEGKAAIGRDGSFSFTFRPEKDGSGVSFQTYHIAVRATDGKGETQEATARFTVGDRSIVLLPDISGAIDKDTSAIVIAAQTLNGEAVATDGTYAFILLEDTGTDGEYSEAGILSQGAFVTGAPLAKGVLSHLPSGRIRMRLSVADGKGRPVEEQRDFVLYGRKDKRPPVFSHIWMPPGIRECSPGEDVELSFGTSDKDVYLLYELFSGGKNVMRRRVELSDENRTFHIPFLESYGEGLTASFTFVKEGKLYAQQTNIMRKRPDRRLALRPETIRDKLLPGSNESLRFKITDATALPVTAEVLAGMYDASLDKIHQFAWRFDPVVRAGVYYGMFSGGEGLSVQYSSDAAQYDGSADIPYFVYDRLDWQGALDFPSRAYPMTRNNALMARSAMAAVAPEEMSVMKKDAGYAVDDATLRRSAEIDGDTPPAALQLRSNFNETAFFFPSMLTDKDGNVTINFVLPESNTTWKLQTLAHTADLKYGVSTHEIITQKPFMTLPNLPRFIRRDDSLRLSAQIINLSDDATSGNARLEIFNPDDGKLVSPLQVQSFALDAGSTTTVSWTVTAPDAAGLVGCRIIAESEAGSDGEQHLLPVLPDEIMLTESAPFYMTDETEKEITVGSGQASPQSRPHSMTLELSGNPAWYAVQSLPSVAEPHNDDAVSWFASYYSHMLSSHIAASNPRIKQMIELWQAQAETNVTLRSNLERNSELKNILLEETPWTLEAKTESERKQQLSLLLDVNRASYLRETAVRELLDQQREDGGWSWFKGLRPSRSITLYIMEGMAQLARLSVAGYTQQEKEMQLRALGYLDKTIREDYELLRKSKASTANYLPTTEQLQYLYVRSSYRDIPEGDAREAIRFYAGQAAKQWTKASLYEKGLIALLMHRNGDDKGKVAAGILAWLRKTATVSAEKGMYWANNRSEGNSLITPIAVHSLLTDVFRALSKDTDEIYRLKQWLLTQKQTQSWGAEPSTVNAVYSLLCDGGDLLSDTNRTTVLWGDKTIETSGAETAGYIKESVNAKDITPAMHTLTLRKEGDAPAWGAVYYQYFEPVGEVNKQGGVLSVEKKLFVETNSGSQLQISPVDADRPLKVGDKVIVRLTIRAGRDMEYVSLKDLRAGCFEPVAQSSGIMAVDRLACYHSPKDVSENFFFDRMPAGTYVLEYAAYVSRSGRYGGGIATLQCLYAPEFVSHTEGNVILVQE